MDLNSIGAAISNFFATTPIMQYLTGGLLSMVSLFVWGYIFLRKEPERKDLVILSFCAGVLSVIPIFVVLGMLGRSSLTIGSLTIPGLNIYSHIEAVAAGGATLEKLGIYILTSILAFFAIYLIIAVLIFLLDILSGEQTLTSYEKILSKSLEAPLIFVVLGTAMGLLAFTFDWSLNTVLMRSLMVGAVEEFAKHLVMRFSDENKFRNINDAIEFSILVALGFAFFENILYFVDKIWLAPCTPQDIASGACLFDKQANKYVHEINVLLIPFLFRSVFSTMTHIISSGIFGYFYGVAYFAADGIKELAKRESGLQAKVLIFFNHILHLKSALILREQKLLQGALFAMVYHGVFNFVLDTETNIYIEELIGRPSMFIIVPLTALGGGYLFYLFKRPENSIIWYKRRVLETRIKKEAIDAAIQDRFALRTPRP